MCTPCNKWFLWPTRVCSPDGISIASSVFARFMLVATIMAATGRIAAACAWSWFRLVDAKTEWVHRARTSSTCPLPKCLSCKGIRTTIEYIIPQTQQTHTHTHPFNGPFSSITHVSQYQKRKTNLDFIEARDSEWQWHQLGHMQVYTLLQTAPHYSVFYRLDALPATQPTVSKHWRHRSNCELSSWPLFHMCEDRCCLGRGQEDSQLTVQGLLTNPGS